jgi:predicted 2-oxoglutarate/Fe(II)-dependent dioxygenase YbiX
VFPTHTSFFQIALEKRAFSQEFASLRLGTKFHTHCDGSVFSRSSNSAIRPRMVLLLVLRVLTREIYDPTISHLNLGVFVPALRFLHNPPPNR